MLSRETLERYRRMTPGERLKLTLEMIRESTPWLLYGPPDVVIEGLQKYVEAGTSYFILAPILDPERRREGLERYAKEVLPALRKMTPAPVP